MKIMIVRHAEPNYEIDSLTEKGWKEAEYLSELMETIDAKAYYVSPLGRAKDTASVSLKRINREGIECPWLREFHAPILKPNKPEKPSVTWDWLPADWTADDRYFNIDTWLEPDIMQRHGVDKEYNHVIEEFDKILAQHGYVRNGRLYDAVNPSNGTIVFFCHFGVECVLLSHILNISPMTLWHGTVAAPSSVTTVATEERRPGIASWRMLAFGERSHLYKNNEKPSFFARFRECYTNENERLD